MIRYDKRNRPYNANAGPIRYQEMIDARAEMCFAFHRAISSSMGTKDCALLRDRRRDSHLPDQLRGRGAEAA